MSITTSTDLPAPIRQSLYPGMLAVPTPQFIYNIPADKKSIPMQGGTTLRLLRPHNLIAPIVPLGNTGIEPPSQVAQRDILDTTLSFYGTSVILNEQVVIQDFFELVLYKSSLIEVEFLPGNAGDNTAQAKAA